MVKNYQCLAQLLKRHSCDECCINGILYQNLLITGSTGLGKSWIACALGHKTCRDRRPVLYQRAPRMFEALALARGDGRTSSTSRPNTAPPSGRCLRSSTARAMIGTMRDGAKWPRSQPASYARLNGPGCLRRDAKSARASMCITFSKHHFGEVR